MRSLVFIFCVVSVIIGISAEPLRYRADLKLGKQQEKPEAAPDSENIEVTTVNNGKPPKTETANEKQVSGPLETKEPCGEEHPTTPEQSIALAQGLDAPYPPSGWRPAGRLLVLPAGVLYVAAQPPPPTTTEVSESTTTEAAEPTTTEVAEPRTQAFTAELSVKGLPTTEESATDVTTTESATTEANTTEDDATEETTEAVAVGDRLGQTKVETTSEPDAESVEVAATEEPKQEEVPEIPQHEQPPSPHAVNTFFIQLADGSFQRVIFLNAPAPAPFPNVPVTAAYQAQPFFQSQPLVANPFYSLATPKLVTYTSQYQSSW